MAIARAVGTYAEYLRQLREHCPEEDAESLKFAAALFATAETVMVMLDGMLARREAAINGVVGYRR